MNQRGFNPFSNIPVVTKNLIIINVLFWLATMIMTKLDLTEMLGLHYPASNGFYLHQIITYMFMHGSLSHLFFNMFAVYMFGRMLESVWGTKRFLTYYMITGIGAGLVNILVAYVRIKVAEADLSPDVITEIYREGYGILRRGMNYTDPARGQLNILINSITVGASGAVFGILLAFGMLFPNMQLYIIPLPFPVKAKYMVIGYGIIELFAGIVDMRGDNVAHFAHLGGMLFGIILVLYWRKKDRDNGRYFY
ncbi:MAG: rhomboid family intramembrane serine protease [Prevotellaceae bacterium]|jgi:membrane associated rhomboid family serine protease|nr:rhomboid family intramembrane serine protease [Prevotellaceae bacterium]